MTLAAFLIIALASAALGFGVLLVMVGAVITVGACEPGFGAGRRRYQWAVPS